MKYYLLLISVCIAIMSSAQVPTGQIKGPIKFYSKIYPGTERNYWVYVPVQYNASKPACSMIVQDGLSRANGWHLSAVLDTLIYKKEVPVIIGIYIDHGQVISKDSTDFPRYNRSFEYDGLSDRYARFLLDEILPEVKKSYNLSEDPNDRSIAGASSGAICAFNAAWERPDAFRRVFSTIGTYVGLRGGDVIHTLVRKTAPKPLRIFLEDGYNDLNIYAGDWYLANQTMLSALTWAGYEVNHAWGEGTHSSTHAVTIIYDALKWLWQGYPAPVMTHPDQYQGLPLVKNQDDWQLINTGVSYVDRIAANSKGEVHFTARDATGIRKLEQDGSIKLLTRYIKTYDEFGFDAKDQLILCGKNTPAISIAEDSGEKVLVPGVRSDKIEITPDGFYFNYASKNKLGYYNFKTKKIFTIPTASKVNGLAVNAEQSFLNSLESDDVFGSSYKINPDGSLVDVQSYIHYHIPYGRTTSETRSAVIDTANLLFAATNMGVQISDQLGRINLILPVPGVFVSDICFGGIELNELYIISNGKLYKRKLNTTGKPATLGMNKPPRPRM